MFAKITTGSLAAGLINYMDNVKEKDARILIAQGLCTASHEAICASSRFRQAEITPSARRCFTSLWLSQRKTVTGRRVTSS